MTAAAPGTRRHGLRRDAPDQREVQPRNSDIGGHHGAFYVEDVDVVVAHLHRDGVTCSATHREH